MNRIMIIASLIITLATLAGCEMRSSMNKNASNENDSLSASPRFVISVDTAKLDIERYNKLMKKYDSIVVASGNPMLSNVPFKAFTVRAVDLTEALGMPLSISNKVKYNHVRVYIGLSEANQFKLFLTPVIGADLDAKPPVAGKDLILKRKIRNAAGEMLNEEEGYVMDFAMPCPNTCPENPLPSN